MKCSWCEKKTALYITTHRTCMMSKLTVCVCLSVGESDVCWLWIQKPLNMKRVGRGIERIKMQVMLSVHVYLYVCVTDMGMDICMPVSWVHTHVTPSVKKQINRERERDTILIWRMTNVCIGELIGKSLYLEPQYMCMIIACVCLCTLTLSMCVYAISRRVCVCDYTPMLTRVREHMRQHACV